MRKRVLITAGGTGGHLYPAQGFASELMERHPDIEILFMAGGLSTNRYFDRSRFKFHDVSCSPLVSRNPLKILKGAFNMAQGIYQGCRLIKQFDPHVVVGFGSYYTVSTLLAAKACRIPIVLHEANSIPGKANKVFAPYVEAVGVHFPGTAALLKGQSFEVGMPLRDGYKKALNCGKSAKRYFQLNEGQPVLLIFGGSQGARQINQRVKQALKQKISAFQNVQVIHLTGDENSIPELQALYQEQGIKVCLKPFENNMNRAWAAADLFLGRAGAATIAEAMEFEVPGLLVPYPHAAENHQETNADFLEHQVKGGIKILESQLTPQRLNEELKRLLEKEHLDSKRQSMNAYKGSPNRQDFSQLVLKIAKNA